MPNTWKASLSLLLQPQRSEPGRRPRIAIVGIGNTLRCDDAAGILVVRALSERGCAADNVLLVEGGQAPENRTGELRAFGPKVVLFIDAADMGREPGEIDWISEEDIDSMSASTHSLPLFMLAQYLKMELGCQVLLLGIQIASNAVGEEVSPEVMRSVKEIVNGLEEIMSSARVS